MVVKNRYRTNPLCYEPGGHTVTVVCTGKVKTKIYERVHYPDSYIAEILLNREQTGLLKIYLDDELIWEK